MYTQRLVLSSISPIIGSIRESNTLNRVGPGNEFIHSTTGMRLWNNLPVDELKLHIERFVVLMYLSEPGTIPSPGLLASIIDMVCRDLHTVSTESSVSAQCQHNIIIVVYLPLEYYHWVKFVSNTLWNGRS